MNEKHRQSVYSLTPDNAPHTWRVDRPNASQPPSITLAPGAFDDLPLKDLIRFLGEHGLRMEGLTICRRDR